jgi:hypothetical protein
MAESKERSMPTLDDIYRKFGEASEAAQLLETELGNILLSIRGTEANLFSTQNPELAKEILRKINRSTLGQLLKQLGNSINSLDQLEQLFSDALAKRNRLAHSFYRDHNFRRNTDEGRAIMMKDLESIHATLLETYKAALAISGIDLDAVEVTAPVKHVKI